MGNMVGPEGAIAIGKALEVNAVLTSCNLMFNSIGDEGAKALACALEVNGVLTSCDLSYNSIGVEGAKALASALEVNAVLTEVNLSSNCIGGGYVKASEVDGQSIEVGAKVIYRGHEVTVVKGLDSYGEIEIQDLTGVVAMAKALEVNAVLTSLNLASNNFVGETGYV